MQNVHEGPIGIGTRLQYSEVGLNAGNVLSDGKSPTAAAFVLRLTLCRTWVLRGRKLRDPDREHDHGLRNIDKPQVWG